MKRIVFLLALLMTFSIVFPIFADGTIQESYKDGTTVIYYSDGSQTVFGPARDISNPAADSITASGSVTRSIPATHYEADGSLAWRFTLTATFTYNGTTAFCTSASYSQTINNSVWSFSNGSATRSGAQATGKGTFTKKILGITVQTVPVTLNLACDENGNVY